MAALARYFLLINGCIGSLAAAAEITLQAIASDLTPPAITEGEPGAGRRVLQALPEYRGTPIRHALYLPRDWLPGKKYPVIVEYSGNGRTVAGGQACLGYGASRGDGFIWICLPFVSEDRSHDTATWWGDLAANVRYCQDAVATVIAAWGGDRHAIFIAGFSRGAIACNVIGLHDDTIAGLWRGMICHSHYDDGRWRGTDPTAANQRLARLGRIPQFITNERPVVEKERIAEHLKSAKPDGAFTFVTLPFTEHTETWVLRDLPERAQLRAWLQRVLATDP